jgi:hypothetical protein
MKRGNMVKMIKKGFTFDEGDGGAACAFCGKEYESIGLVVRFEYGHDICSSCLLKGPKVVGSETTKRPAREFHSDYRRWFMEIKGFAHRLKALDDFRDLPCGLLAIKIAEAYRDTPKRRTEKAA